MFSEGKGERGYARVSYGGYQVGLAFWKATLQGFGMAMSAQVLRDRLIGIAFGLIVYGLVEHYVLARAGRGRVAREPLRVQLQSRRQARQSAASTVRAHHGSRVAAARVIALAPIPAPLPGSATA